MAKIKKNNLIKKKFVKKRIKKNNIFLVIFLFTFSIIFLFIIIYYNLLYPRKITAYLKKDLLDIYTPVVFSDSDNIFVLKLKEKPTINIQTNVYKKIKKKYDLDTKFEKINSNEESGINKLLFFRNNKEYKTLISFYIFWDITIKENLEKDIAIPENSEVHYEKIEEERKNEMQETLLHPDINKFKHGKYQEIADIKEKPKIAIVIDDLGYSYNSTFDFLTLGFPVTFSVIPDMPNSKKFYNLFYKMGYEIMLHIPMEPLKGKQYVEKNALLIAMDDKTIKNEIDQFLEEYPNIVGANNHMGSKAVTDARLMNIVLNELSNKNKLWLDSMTNLHSITNEVARIHKMHYYKRDVFLDNTKDKESIRKSMELLIKNAKKNGTAIGIGHVQTRELVDVLKEYYNNRNELGIEFVPMSRL